MWSKPSIINHPCREALDETLQLDRAVTAALEMVDTEETLIIVTADHSHALTINGYPDRGDDIFGYAGHGHDGLYYPTLMYGTGPGYKVKSPFCIRVPTMAVPQGAKR